MSLITRFRKKRKHFCSHLKSGGEGRKGPIISFQGGASPYALYNIESLIITFTNKYICFQSLFKVRMFETKDNYFREA